MKGAELFVTALKARGVEWLSSLCGHGLNEVYAACRRLGVRVVDTRNEQAAAYLADAWARLSGRVGVCAVSSGIGHVNALSGVVNAYFDGSPMLLVSGAGALTTMGRGHFQDLDQVALAAPVCKYARVIDQPERIPEYVDQALAAALAGRPGPVHLTFPIDVQEAQVQAAEWAVHPGKPPRPRADQAAVARAAKLFAGARRPLLVAGTGAYYAGAERALAGFASAYAVPVVVPIWDRGSVPGPMAEFMGVLGAATGDPALLAQADLVVLLGAAVDYRVGYLEPPSLAPEARLVRVEVEPGRLAAGRPADLAIPADPTDFLEQLHEVCVERRVQGFEDWLAQAARERDEFCRQALAGARRQDGLHALDIMEVLENDLSPEAVLVLDGGSIGQWFHQTLGRRRYPGHWLTCGASAVIGFGIAGAIACRIAFPHRPVVLLTGDGSATFNITELECAARQGLPFVMVVADDQSWGITASGQRRQYGELMHSSLGPVDFAGIAQALGALGTRVSTRAELEVALRQAVQERLPVVVQVPITGGMPGE